MNRLALVVGAVLTLAGSAFPDLSAEQAKSAQSPQAASASQGPTPAELDALLAPVALYPDQLLAQILQCAVDPASVAALNDWMKRNASLKGTELQDAAMKEKFEPSFVALTLFPQVVEMMASQRDWTTRLGQAFTKNRAAVFESIQRLRAQAQKAGTLKTTPQQEVNTQTTQSGQQVIVIEPANPQVVYVPQYNPQVVYTQPTTTVVVQEQSSSADAAVAGLIGFTAGIAIGAAFDNDYYYGPYGWHGGAYMYNDAWNDYYDHREDAREDWMDHREDIVEERGDRARESQEQRTERQGNRQENRPESQAQRQERRTQAQSAQSATPRTTTSSAQAGTSGTSSSSYGARGHTQGGSRTTTQSGARSDAFSGYSSGKSQRAASSRGQSSRSSSRGGGGRRR
jgi:hypothetical protein